MATTEPLFAEYWTKEQLAALIPGGGVSPRTLDRWHARRVGPPRIRCGNLVLYPKAGVQAWLDRRLAEAEAEFAKVEANR